jgi:hypothetical protein
MTKKQLDTLKTVVSADITVFIIWSNWKSYQFTQLLLLFFSINGWDLLLTELTLLLSFDG